MSKSDVDAAAFIAARCKELGFVMRKSLEVADNRNELYVSPCGNGMAYTWRRRDHSTTLHAIAVCKDCRLHGVGSSLIARIVADGLSRDHTILRARCPETLPSNQFYARLGFFLGTTEPGRLIQLNVWELRLAPFANSPDILCGRWPHQHGHSYPGKVVDRN